MIPAAPNKPVVARRARARARRPDFRGRRREGPPYIDFGSVCPNGSSGSTKTEPAVEAQAVSTRPAYPSRKGHTNGDVDPATAKVVDEASQGGFGSCCIPSTIFAELKAKEHLGSARAAALPGWGCFRPVVLPSKISSTRTLFHEEQKKPRDGDNGGGGRPYRFGVSASFRKKETSMGSPRARDQVKALSTALRSILCGVRSGSRPARTQLAKAAAEGGADAKGKALLLASGGRKGLEVIAALEGVVTDEGEVFEACFRELVRQERCACRQRAELMEVMREHYASLFKEVVDHLSQLKASLQETLGEEERLKEQAHRVQKLAKLLAEDAKTNDDHRRKLASIPHTELERFIASRTAPNTTTGNIPAGEGDNNGRSGSSSSKSDSSNNNGGTVKPAQRESAGLLAGLMSEASDLAVKESQLHQHQRAPVRSEPMAMAEANNAIELTDRTRHMLASCKMDMLQEMIDERVAARREMERRENWRRYNAATTIKNWWRKVNPPEWEEEDRQYAATLIQAYIRGKIARIKRNRAVEQFRATRGAIALQNVYRRYLAVRERRRRAHIVRLALGAGIRTLARAVGELEARVLPPPDEGARVPPGRDHSTSAGVLHRDERSSGAATEDSQSSHLPEKSGDNPDKAAVDGVVVAEKAQEKEDTVCTLVERLKALAEVWEKRRCSNVSEDFLAEDARFRRNNSASNSNSPVGPRKTATRRRR